MTRPASALVALLAVACGAAPADTAPSLPPPTEETEPAVPAPLPYAAPGEDSDFPAKGPPRTGDWLERFPEKGQTAAEYRDACVNRVTPDRRTIVIQPLGRLAEGRAPLLEKVREFAAAFFAVDARVADPIPAPRGAWNEARRQIDGDAVLRHLENRLPGSALAFVGLCEEDLFSGDLNFVFGVASLRRRAGVYGLARYGGGGDALFLRRTLKVFSHETGHILGMEHCVRYDCLMNGSNSLPETDRQSAFLCPECHEKLRWNARFDPKARYAALASFYAREGLEEEAKFARRQAAK